MIFCSKGEKNGFQLISIFMYIFSGCILPAQCNTFHKSKKCASNHSKPGFLCFWGTGLCDFDDPKRLSQLSVRGTYGKNKPESRVDWGSGNQYRHFKRI